MNCYTTALRSVPRVRVFENKRAGVNVRLNLFVDYNMMGDRWGQQDAVLQD